MKTRDSQGRYVKSPIEDRFWEKVDKSAGPDACWPFSGEITKAGYGRITDYWNKTLAHRFAYTQTFGAIPAGMLVLHSCDNRICVNPAHLRMGTHKENRDDMLRRGRQNYGQREGKKGSENKKALLTEAQVIEIRRRYTEHGDPTAGWVKTDSRPGRVSIRTLAAEYGVNPSTIHHILIRRTWAHI